MTKGLEALEHGLGKGMSTRLEAEDAHLLCSVLYVLSVPQSPAKVSIDAGTRLNFANRAVWELVLGTAYLLAHLWTEICEAKNPSNVPLWILGCSEIHLESPDWIVAQGLR